MEGDSISEDDLFAAVAGSGARALLIGRRALVALGLPMMTADYDYWIHIDDIERFNAALVPLGLTVSRSPADARATGRYALENGERIEVIVARAMGLKEGGNVAFDELWPRRESLEFSGTRIAIPSPEDLVRTKRVADRPKDREDIQLLHAWMKKNRGK